MRSPAMIVAMLALFISLTGNAVAVRAFVTSKDIKDGTIQLRDLSAAARDALRGQDGARGPQGSPGPQGVQGSQGPPGPSANVTLLESKVSTLEGRVRNLCPIGGRFVKDVMLNTYSTIPPSLSVRHHYCSRF